MDQLCRHLPDAWEMEALGVSPSSIRLETDSIRHGVPMRVRQGPFPKLRAEDGWLDELMRARRPDVVLAVGPTLITGPLIEQLQTYRSRSRIALYLPAEGAPSGPALATRLTQVDLCLTYTQAAADGLRRIDPHPNGNVASIQAVGHGVELAGISVRATSDALRRAARRAVFPGRADLEAAFLVLNPNRDYPRKRLDLTIAAFAKFSQDKQDAWLVLHPGPESDADYAAIVALADQAGVRGRLLMPFREAASATSLVDLYRACDVGLSTAQGEGWGLTAFEHAATGAPMVLPDHTTFRELWREAALFARCGDPEFVFFECADMFPVDVASVADQLNRLYADPILRKQVGAACRSRATEARFQWAAAATSLSEACKRIVSHALATTG